MNKSQLKQTKPMERLVFAPDYSTSVFLPNVFTTVSILSKLVYLVSALTICQYYIIVTLFAPIFSSLFSLFFALFLLSFPSSLSFISILCAFPKHQLTSVLCVAIACGLSKKLFQGKYLLNVILAVFTVE
jgi:hypothetical protein